MTSSLKKRLYNSIISLPMLTSVVLGLILQFINEFRLVTPSFMSNGNFKYLDSIHATHVGGFDIFAPIFAVLPAGIMFCEDYNSGYIKAILNRMSIKRYIKESIVVSIVSGGLAIFLPSLISSIYFVYFGSAYDISEIQHKADIMGSFSIIYDGSLFEQYQYVYGGLLIVGFLLLLSFSFGAIFSMLSLLIGAITKNKYLALSLPFAIYYTLFLIMYRIPILLIYSPVNMLLPDILPTIRFVVIYHLTIFIAVLFLLKFIIRWRIHDV